MTTTDRDSAGASQPEFRGFPAGARTVPLPAAMFTTVFPALDDVAELIVTLYATAAIQRLRRFPRLLESAALRSERALIETLARLLPGDEIDAAFRRGLDAAIARGTLLSLSASDGSRTQELITLNTAPDRRALERVRRGQLAGTSGWQVKSAPPPPEGRGATNVYTLYEATVGPITPQIADELAEAEGLYPEHWIVDAFREAAELNKRSWRYVQRILERWQNEGRDDEAFGRHSRWRPDSRYDHLIRR